jgi:hypothetical protein
LEKIIMSKSLPQFTWYRWGSGAERWGSDSREKASSILKAARKRHECERVDNGLYRVSLRGHDIMALIRTK